jgi:hypothetical protein
MLTEHMDNSDENLIEVVDHENTNIDFQSHSVLDEPDPILNIKTNLLKQEEVKKYGNRFLEDGMLTILKKLF